MSKVKYIVVSGVLFLVALFTLTSCSSGSSYTEEVEEVLRPVDPVWAYNNTIWFMQIADSARTAIAQAKRQYGEEWEDHCDWRMYKSLLLSVNTKGPVTDSICVRILPVTEEERWPYNMDNVVVEEFGEESPTFSDSVYVAYRGWLMQTYEAVEEGGPLQPVRTVFSQSYIGDYNKATCSWLLSSVSTLTEGFGTAVQYMHSGDSWMVYVPSNLGYGGSAQDYIPAYSTLQFHIKLVKWKRSGMKGFY